MSETTLPAAMRAIVITGFGGPEKLALSERPLPMPGAGEILVKVAAAGVNRPDVLQRQGHHPAPPGAPQDIPGLDIAGEVVALGTGARRYRVGDMVTALVAGGGYAEYCVAAEGSALPAPPSLSPIAAAAIPETFFTVWSNLVDRAHLGAGETLLIHGGASGIGTTAIQIARAIGAAVIVTAGSDEKAAACRALGADAAVNYRTEDFVAAVRAFSGGRGTDVILDIVGGDYVGRNFQAAAEDGRIVQIAFLKGSRTEVDLRLLMTKRLTHTGSTLRWRSTAFKAAIATALEARVWPWIAEGRVAPVIDRTYPLEDAALAHQRMEAGEHFGKIVLAVASA